MTRLIVLRAPASMVERRQPLLDNSDESSRGGVRKLRIAEVAGRTTAECAAVCCCCPCSLVNLFVLAVYKVPAGLCRKALRKKRRRRMIKKGLAPPRNCGCEDSLLHIHPVASPVAILAAMETSSAATEDNKSDNVKIHDVDKDVLELEEEMWDKFYGAGFWRSSSQRSETSSAVHLQQ